MNVFKRDLRDGRAWSLHGAGATYKTCHDEMEHIFRLMRVGGKKIKKENALMLFSNQINLLHKNTFLDIKVQLL